jgi:thiamine pyrophosphokinase
MIETDVTVILADGQFPAHPIPLAILRKGLMVICCDGAAQKLIGSGIRMPDYVVGDLDSLNQELLDRLGDKVIRVESQDSNDLTKAFELAQSLRSEKIVILGATGLREDHTLGNISLLARYAEHADVIMYTDYGRFIAISETTAFPSHQGQQVSIFSLTPNTPITYEGLRWDVKDRPLLLWWEGTLNEALGDRFTVKFNEGKVLVYQVYENSDK